MAGGVIVAGKQNSARKQPPECVSASPDEQLTLESWPFFFTKIKAEIHPSIPLCVLLCSVFFLAQYTDNQGPIPSMPLKF